MSVLPFSEFEQRLHLLRKIMAEQKIDVLLVYGDEYRREHLRYVSNYWPIFERGMLAIGQTGDPILLVAPECLQYAIEMSPWKDIRIIHEMEMAYVSDQIEYSTDKAFTNLETVFSEILNKKAPQRIMVCGIDAMSSITLDAIKKGGNGAQIVNGDPTIYGMRLIKSLAEVNLLSKAWKICDTGYKALLDANLVGMTERQAAAIAEMAARQAGAESIVFTLFACGERTNTVIGRASERIIQEGDLVMACLAVQYEGYIASDEWPFVAGGKPTQGQADLIRHLIVAEDIGIQMVRDGVVAGQVVGKIRDYFAANGLTKYDLYPPIHGNGLAEAESPYPDENTTYTFRKGMGINFDVSLFGLPGIGSNRVEEGFIIAEDGLITLSALISGLRKDFLKNLH
jgi:Xaa-Pro aminopeptidase